MSSSNNNTGQKFQLNYLQQINSANQSRQTPTSDIQNKITKHKFTSSLDASSQQNQGNNIAFRNNQNTFAESRDNNNFHSFHIGQIQHQNQRLISNEDSPTHQHMQSEVTRVKPKVGNQRKGHQVSQSAGFKKGVLKNGLQVNKSFENDKAYQSYLNVQQTPNGYNSNAQVNQRNNPQSNLVITQFQTIQAAQQQLNQKRNLSLGNNYQQKKHQQSLSNDRSGQQQSKPGSKAGARSGDASLNRGSRFITSNNRRGPTGVSGVPSDLGDNFGLSDNNTIDTHQLVKSSLGTQNTGEINQPNFNVNTVRPKTSMGQQSYLEKQAEALAASDPHQQELDDILAEKNRQLIDKQYMSYQTQNSSQQKNFIIRKDRNEGLRSYLRKSLDQANLNSRSVVQSVDQSNTTGVSLGMNGLNFNLGLQQQDSNQSTSKGNGSKLNISKIKRKRDYSKVVGGSMNQQQFATLQQQQQVQNLVVSPSKSNKNQQVPIPKKNLYHESFSSMQDQKQELISQLTTISNSIETNYNSMSGGQAQQNQDSTTGIIRKSSSKTHYRSQTSHKLNRPHQKEHPVGISSLKTTLELDQSQDPNSQGLTITQDEQKTYKQSHSEERPTSSKMKAMGANSNFNNMRASITHEVNTQNTVVQEIGQKKVDNCVSKFAFATKTGFSPNNPYKVNQDSFLAMPHLGEYRRTHFFSVCDGHGVYGKEVSEYVKTLLGQKVEQEIKRIFDLAKQSQRVVDSNEVKDALAISFNHVTNSLYTSSDIDIYFSGSTCVTVLIVGNKVFCANVGDSRAVLAREIDGQITGYPLNRDHKANEPDEEKRILMNGGRCEAFKDSNGKPMGPLRVWHLNENIPGLAMTRSFGDHCAAEVGCIAEPEILEMNLTENDKFIVLASDGVWEFLSNDEVSKIIYPHYLNNSAEKAAEALIREALKKWKQEENVVDDITCIIIFLSIQQ